MNENEVVKRYSDQKSENLKGIVIGLIGELGSGKTHLVKKILKRISLDFEKQVHSPTFNLCNIYQASHFEIHHFDLYRIESKEELFDIDIWESMENNQILTFIEWINYFPELVENCNEVVSLSVDENNTRDYQISVFKT